MKWEDWIKHGNTVDELKNFICGVNIFLNHKLMLHLSEEMSLSKDEILLFLHDLDSNKFTDAAVELSHMGHGIMERDVECLNELIREKDKMNRRYLEVCHYDNHSHMFLEKKNWVQQFKGYLFASVYFKQNFDDIIKFVINYL